MTVVFDADWKSKTKRRCSGCNLCCRLLPVRDINKPAGERCKHQKHNVGCAIYHKSGFPLSCGLWSCRWLLNMDTANLHRPDRSHVVIDVMEDFITHVDNATGKQTNIAVLQIWVDPKYPDAWRDPALLAFLDRRGRDDGMAALIRYSSKDGFVVFPPSISADGQWHEQHSAAHEREHSAEEKLAAIAGARKVIVG